MSNPLDTEAGSELYSGYEADYKLVAADLNQQLDALNTSVGEQRKAGTNRAEATLAEAKELVRFYGPPHKNTEMGYRIELTGSVTSAGLPPSRSSKCSHCHSSQAHRPDTQL